MTQHSDDTDMTQRSEYNAQSAHSVRAHTGRIAFMAIFSLRVPDALCPAENQLQLCDHKRLFEQHYLHLMHRSDREESTAAMREREKQ